MSRTVSCLAHLPERLQEYYEFKLVAKATNPELQKAVEETERTQNNLFIKTCDENGIQWYEKYLGIRPYSSDTLEIRINRVLSRWNDDIPYNYKTLISKLDVLCGENKYIIAPNFLSVENVPELRLTTFLEFKGEVAELSYLLDYILPCNVNVALSNSLFFNSEAVYFLGSAWSETQIVTY